MKTFQKLFVSSNDDMRKLSGILYGVILSAMDDTVSKKHVQELISSIMDKNRSKSLELYSSLYALSSHQEHTFYYNRDYPSLIGRDIFTSLGNYIF